MPDLHPAASLNDEVISIIRVAAAGAAGFGVTQLLRLGVHVDPALLVAGLTSVFSTAYYAAERYLSKHFPWASRLLVLKNPNPAS
jgi:hypothetical protein